MLRKGRSRSKVAFGLPQPGRCWCCPTADPGHRATTPWRSQLRPSPRLGVDSALKSGLGPPHGRLSLQSQSDDRSSADGDPAELVSALVSPWLRAPLPLTLDEHLPAAPLVGHTAFRHPASYPIWLIGGNIDWDRGRLTSHRHLCGVLQPHRWTTGRDDPPQDARRRSAAPV